MMRWLDSIRNTVRKIMGLIARLINTASGGSISPNFVTLVGFAMHIPIAYLIATQYFLWASALLIIFGLFDTLDGELARLQKRASARGMLLDASTDRMKEVILYIGAGAALTSSGYVYGSALVWTIAACGASLCVSYIKAKGETALKDSGLSPNEINRLFQDGLARFEIRMLILVIGLLTNRLLASLVIITVLSTYTAFERLIKISRKLA